MKKLEKLLQTHDWYYDRSDDHSVWERGSHSYKTIRKLIKESDNIIEAVELYNRYNPSKYKLEVEDIK
jgi:hypothetical protein